VSDIRKEFVRAMHAGIGAAQAFAEKHPGRVSVIDVNDESAMQAALVVFGDELVYLRQEPGGPRAWFQLWEGEAPKLIEALRGIK
jgi:hypothetical protein